MIKYSVILYILILTGCAAPTTKVVTQYVRTPVRFCPAPPTIQRPWLEAKNIQESDTDGDVAIKYHATIVALKHYAEELEDIIKFYKTISQQNQSRQETK